MSRPLVTIVAALVLLSAGCGRLGLGLPACDTPPGDPSTASVITAQAVPRADYAPCLNSLKLGWDEVEFEVESNLMILEFGRTREFEFQSFLEVRLTPSCDVGDAVPVPSGMDDVERFDNIDQVVAGIGVTIIPDGERPRIFAQSLVDDLGGVRVEGRQVSFTVDTDIDFSVRSRVNKALFTDEFVWIINDLDIDEGTLELRSTPDGEGARGLEVDEALDLMEDTTPEVRYQGQWFYVFNGGCITYDFDAEGTLATTIEQDAVETIGFYPNAELREAGLQAGYDLVGE
ncbi:MAG: hypothetical protein GY926_06460 [bacterium]|nr:hypothetical protein [bacterium]MCP4964861.1 hypothetical protein [bacterium]